MSIIILVILCIWHSTIGLFIFYYYKLTDELEPTNIYILIDRFVFVGAFTLYILIHITLGIWLIRVPYKRRREMEYLDREYVAKKHIQLTSGLSRYGSKQDLSYRRSSSVVDTLPPIRTLRTMRSSEGIIMMPSAATFIPIIPEVTNEKTMNMFELREQNEKCFDEIKSNHVPYVE